MVRKSRILSPTCSRSLITIGCEMKKLLGFENLITTSRTRTFLAIWDPFSGPLIAIAIATTTTWLASHEVSWFQGHITLLASDSYQAPDPLKLLYRPVRELWHQLDSSAHLVHYTTGTRWNVLLVDVTYVAVVFAKSQYWKTWSLKGDSFSFNMTMI